MKDNIDISVWNYDDIYPRGATYIGRGTPWGNPFIIGIHGSRSEVIEKFRQAITPNFEARIKAELKGKDLVCHCRPKACHGDVLFEIANTQTLF